MSTIRALKRRQKKQVRSYDDDGIALIRSILRLPFPRRVIFAVKVLRGMRGTFMWVFVPASLMVFIPLLTFLTGLGLFTLYKMCH